MFVPANICEQPQSAGPCGASIVRFSYDTNTGVCSTFIYGGCLGSTNRFDTFEICQVACIGKLQHQIHLQQLFKFHLDKYMRKKLFPIVVQSIFYLLAGMIDLIQPWPNVLYLLENYRSNLGNRNCETMSKISCNHAYQPKTLSHNPWWVNSKLAMNQAIKVNVVKFTLWINLCCGYIYVRYLNTNDRKWLQFNILCSLNCWLLHILHSHLNSIKSSEKN